MPEAANNLTCAPRVSVLIATRNRPEDLVPCLRSLLAQEYDDYEIVVFDQSTSDAAERAVQEAFGCPERLRLIRSATVGKSLAVNCLMETERGQIFAFTDDDTEARPDWLTNIVQVFDAEPDLDILFGQVRISPKVQGDPYLYTPAIHFTERRYLKRGEIAGMGANMAMRRDIAMRTGRFDTQLGPGTSIPAAEEGDFLYRAHRQGARIVMEPAVQLVHLAVRQKSEWVRVLEGYGFGDASLAMKHLRCGDLPMLRKMAHGLFYIFARGCLRVVQRRQHAEFYYVRGYWRGLWNSFRFRIDRKERLYQLRGAKPQDGAGGDARQSPAIN